MWARCLVPLILGDSSAAAVPFMATSAVKVAMGHRIPADEVRQGARGPSRLYLDTLAVLHGTSFGMVTRGVK